MTEDKMPERMDLRYDPTLKQDTQSTPVNHEYPDSGPSSLYGRVGDNLTFHTQGAGKRGFFELLWHSAWKDLRGALFGFFRIFLPSRDK
ncbi:MAG: hypothetical protein ACLGQH_08770 [Acidobacteriota bacterium]